MESKRDKLLREFYETHTEPAFDTSEKKTKDINGITHVVLDCPIEEYAKRHGLINIEKVIWRR